MQSSAGNSSTPKDRMDLRMYLKRKHLLTSGSQLPFIVEPAKAMGSLAYPDHKGPAVVARNQNKSVATYIVEIVD